MLRLWVGMNSLAMTRVGVAIVGGGVTVVVVAVSVPAHHLQFIGRRMVHPARAPVHVADGADSERRDTDDRGPEHHPVPVRAAARLLRGDGAGKQRHDERDERRQPPTSTEG